MVFGLFSAFLQQKMKPKNVFLRERKSPKTLDFTGFSDDGAGSRT